MFNTYDPNTYESTNPLIKDSVLGSKFLNPDYLFNHGVEYLGYIFNSKTLGGFYAVLSFFSIFFIAIILYCTVRMFEVRRKEHAYLHHEIAEYAHNQALREEKSRGEGVFKNERWKKVLNLLFSDSSNDWKLSIIEADTMLFDLLTGLGFKGDTLGDKLKTADRDSFKTLSAAWEVHNIRNKIAHEGSSFELSLHEAKRVVALYEQIFLEFGHI